MDCIRLNGYEKKKLSKNNARLRGLAPDFIGGEAVFQVDVLKVVEVNGSGIIQRHIKVIRIAAEQRHGRGGLTVFVAVDAGLCGAEPIVSAIFTCERPRLPQDFQTLTHFFHDIAS